LDMQGVIVEVGKHSDNFNQNPNWPHILTQPAISLPLRPNFPSIRRSWDWYHITQPGAHPASPDGFTSTAGITTASATAASLICERPPTEASLFPRWLDTAICFRSSFARLILCFTYYCVLIVPDTRVIYYIVLFYVYRVRKTHFAVFFARRKGRVMTTHFATWHSSFPT
jgi:hypothetical protein